MSVKYHINRKTGRPNICRATIQACPVGGDHFEHKADAQKYIETKFNEEFGQVKTFNNARQPGKPVKQAAPRKVFAIENEKYGIMKDAKVEDSIVTFPDGYQTEIIDRGDDGIAKGDELRALMDSGRFDSLSPEELARLKTVLDEGERDYTDRAKKQILKVFSMSSQDAIGFNMNYDHRNKWRDELLNDSVDYKYSVPLGTQKDRAQYNKNRKKNIVNSYDESIKESESQTAGRTTSSRNTQAPSVERGDTVISFRNIRNNFIDTITGLFRG